ncbi:MAG: CoA transferase, partial [Candidatus Tectomicrobia bacterium]|nr:CoA transferase [Candidatus Tectomicrobia bacterium]
EALNALLAECLLTKTRAEWIDLFSEQRILCGPVYSYEALFEDPQFQHNDMLREVPRSDGSLMRVVDSPIRLSETPSHLHSAPPQLGHHTDAVLGALGYDATAITQLRQDGVVG